MSVRHQGLEQRFGGLSRVFVLYRPFLGVFLVLGLLNAGVQLADLAALYVFGRIIDAVITLHSAHQVLPKILAMFSVSVAGIFFRQCVQIYSVKNLEFVLPTKVAISAWERLFSLSIGQHHSKHSGLKHSVMNRGLYATDALAKTIAHEGLFVSLRILITTTAVCIFYPSCGIVLILGIVGFFALTWHLNSTFRPGFQKVQNAGIDRDKLQVEVAQNMNLIQINAQEDRMRDELVEAFESHANLAKKIYTQFHVWSLGVSSVPMICRILIMCEGIFLIQRGQIKAGGLVTCMLWASDTLSRLEWMNSLNQAVVERLTSIKTYLSLLDTVPLIAASTGITRRNSYQGCIEFRNVSFRYPQLSDMKVADPTETLTEQWALRDVSFRINQGESVVVVGPSGAGKSTLLKLLLRAYEPDQGQILVDGTDIRDLNVSDLRRAIGVVEQTVALLDRSLRENIMFAAPVSDYTDESHLEEILRIAQLEDVVSRLPAGLDSGMGENGVRMSGGERQRIGIARALAKKPRMLFFDEATSQLDAVNELLVREAITRSSQSKTVIVIAHQIQSFIDARRIIVIEGGCVVGDGAHHELQQDCSWYGEMTKDYLVPQ